VEALRVERDGPVLRVTLARPERRNAFDATLIAELTAAFVDVGEARVVVLAGDGVSFCAGGDAEWMRASAGLSFSENVEDALRLGRMLEAVDGCPAPVVAAVQGHAFGGGAGLVACSDVAVTHPGTVFAFSEVKLGVVPGVISPFVLAKIGTSAARSLFVTGRRFDAPTALRIGLAHELADDVDAAVEGVVAELLTAGPTAARVAKTLARAPLPLEETARLIAESRVSAEGQEGLRAFLDGRHPGRAGFASWCPPAGDA
jgi:enoyl-CoA hydratase/carnithine racemase